MSPLLLALIAGSGEGTVDPPPTDPPPTDPPLPYAIPTAYPYNVPVYSDLPTPDGTGSATHPAVWDFGAGNQWNGYRFWMANTPYYLSDISLENPCVWGSNNGYDWEVPDGGPNPVYPYLGGGQHYSDTDIWYDEVADELLLIWRGPGENINLASSPDGRTWPALQDTTIIIDGSNLPASTAFLSPSLVHAHDGTWRLYGNSSPMSGFTTATSPYGPFSGWTEISWPAPWHHAVIYDPADGLYLLAEGQRIYRSYDGITWGGGPKVLADSGGSGMWEQGTYYRNAIRPYSSTHYSLWYTNNDGTTNPPSNYTAYTRVPKTALHAPLGTPPA